MGEKKCAALCTFAGMKVRVEGLLGWCFLLLSGAAICTRCARVMAPEGGPKDTEPPALQRVKPNLFTVNFTGDEIRLYFDEMVTTKDFHRGVEVSPPLKYPLIPIERGKSLSLTFRDTLRQDFTYRVDLSNVVVDLTEGNKALHCVYVFSTGARIDSGLVTGIVRDAYTHSPVENSSVQLYATEVPGAAVDSFPDAAARVGGDGVFRVENLRERSFQIVALVDINGNRRYDLPTEKIAFLDHTVSTLRMPSFIDTTGLDSVRSGPVGGGGAVQDSVALRAQAALRASRDSLRNAQREKERAARVVLNLFEFARPKQLLTKRERPEAGLVRFVFSCPPQGDVRVEPVSPQGVSFVEERSRQGDTIVLWAADTATRSADTLFFTVHSLRSDSLNELRPWTDTLRLGFKKKRRELKSADRRGSGRDSSVAAVREPLKISALDANAMGSIKPGDTLFVRSQYPYASVDTSKIHLIAQADTSFYPFSIVRFKARPRDIGITARWPVDSSFLLVADSGALVSYFGASNDSTAFALRTYRPDSYSALHFTLRNAPGNCILQLFVDSVEKKTVREVIARGDGSRATISYLPPGVYYLRIVDDRNGDGKWTTGDFGERRQPEAVRYYVTARGESEIATRANWEYELDIDYSVLEE